MSGLEEQIAPLEPEGLTGSVVLARILGEHCLCSLGDEVGERAPRVRSLKRLAGMAPALALEDLRRLEALPA